MFVTPCNFVQGYQNFGGIFSLHLQDILKKVAVTALLAEPGGGSFAGGPKGYERRALGTGNSLHGGSVGQPGGGLVDRVF